MKLRAAIPTSALVLGVFATAGAAVAAAATTNPSIPPRTTATATVRTTNPSRTAPSVSATTPDLSGAIAACVQAIDLRVAKLGALGASLGAANAVTDAHRSTEQASLTAAADGLAQLKGKVQADGDARTLKADCESVMSDYRVFAVRAPQTGLIIAGDSQAASVARLQAAVPKLSDALTKLADAGKDVSAAKASLDDLQAKLADAGPKAQGLADSVIGFQPADYNANKALFTPAHTTVLEVRADLAAARTDLKAIGAALKALRGH
jgi:hypothetical protein